MSRRIKVTAVASLAVVVLAVVLAVPALAQQSTPVPGGGMMGGSTGMMSGGTVTPSVPGQNMMGGRAAAGAVGSSTGVTAMLPFWMQQMMGSGVGITGTLPFWMQQMMPNGIMGNGASGYGMMGNGASGYGMMGNGMMGAMGMSGGWSDPNAKPLTLDQAQAAARKYIQALPNNAGANLAPTEVMEFSNGFYVAVGDKTAGTGAFEVLVDRYNGNNVFPEPGPNMMWNTKYGMMGGQQGGMMGMMGLWTPPSDAPLVSEQQARTNAQKFLDTKFPGAKLPQDIMGFPGYYTVDFEINDQPAGMLSVNAYTGQVWYHTWHGQFLSESTAK